MIKKCTLCGETKDYKCFHKSKISSDGYRPRCKECRKKEHDKYYRENADKWRRNYLDNREKVLEKVRRHREENREEINERNRRRYSDDDVYRKKRNKQSSDYYLKNKEEKNRYNKKYYENNKMDILERNKESYEKNKREWSATRKKWRMENRERIYSLNHSRRVMERSVTREFYKVDWDYALDYFGGKCAYCSESGRITRDHFIPLSKGGNHTKDNIVPCCSSCNSSKQDNDFEDWYSKKKFYSQDREKKIKEFLRHFE